jgi:hypothetical protein
MAIAAIDELWFSSQISDSPQKAKSSRPKANADGATTGNRATGLVAQSIVLMNVAGSFRERPSPLEDVLKSVCGDPLRASAARPYFSKEVSVQILEKHGDKGSRKIVARFRDIVDALVNFLVEDLGPDFVSPLLTDLMSHV